MHSYHPNDNEWYNKNKMISHWHWSVFIRNKADEIVDDVNNHQSGTAYRGHTKAVMKRFNKYMNTIFP